MVDLRILGIGNLATATSVAVSIVLTSSSLVR